MKRYVRSHLLYALDLLVLTVAFQNRAHAYVDPGSGLLAFQVGGSILAGSYFVLRGKLRRLFRLGRAANESSPQDKPIEVAEVPASDSSRKH